MDRAVVRHNQQHALLGVKGNGGRQIDDVRRVFVNFQIAGGGFPAAIIARQALKTFFSR
jgi:hypothetical protein